MYVEDKILQEKIFTRDHIDEIYSIFVLLCDNKKYKLTPADFTNNLKKIAQSKQINVSEDLWNQYFLQIDYDKDGRIDFQDFLRYFIQNLKLILGEIYFKSGLNQVHSLCTLTDKKIFYTVFSSFYYKPFNMTNFFFLTDTAQYLLPSYKSYTRNINRQNLISQKSSEEKFTAFAHMLNYINDKDYIRQIAECFSGEGIIRLKKILKPINYITNHYIVIQYTPQIMEGLKNLAVHGIFQEIINTMNKIFSDISDQVLYCLLKIIKRILSLSNFLIESKAFCSENKLNYISDNYCQDIENFKLLIENSIIQNILEKLPSCFNKGTYEFFISSSLVFLNIAKLSTDIMCKALVKTNFLDVLILRAQDFKTVINVNTIKDINVVFFCCIELMQRIFSANDVNGICYDALYKSIEKINSIVASLSEQFFLLAFSANPNQLTLALYMNLMALVSFKTDCGERFFIIKFMEKSILQTNAQLIFPFYFLIKCLLKNGLKTPILNIVFEYKILNKFYEYTQYNIDFLSDFLDLIEVIITDQRENLLTSAIIREVISTLNDLLMNRKEISALPKIIKILNDISSFKDSLINDLILDTDLISYVITYIINNCTSREFYNEYFLITKTRYNTVMISNGLFFIYNVLSGDVVKVNQKFEKQFNIINLNKLKKFFADLASIWDIKETGTDNALLAESEVFEKYKDLPKENLLVSIIKIFEQLSFIIHLNIETKNNIESLLTTMTAVDESIKQMKIALRELDLDDADQKGKVKAIPLVTIYTQSGEEAKNKSCTSFEFPSESLKYDEVLKSLQENYGNDIEIYAKEKEIYMRIKNENDFLKLMRKVYEEYNTGQQKQIEVFFMIIEKQKKAVIITNCMSCGKKIEILASAKTEEGNNESIILDQTTSSPPLCEECKNFFFSQIANEISKNKTINLNNISNNNISSLLSPVRGDTSFMTTPGPLRVLSKTTFIDK